MTQQLIKTTPANSNQGDPPKIAYDKTNANFTELYGFAPGVTGPSYFGIDSGVVNAYVFTHSGTVPATLAAGTIIRLPAVLNTNTGPATMNADGSGAVAMIRANGQPLTGGEASSLGPLVLQSTGTQWQIVSTAGAQPGYERTAAEVSAAVIPTAYNAGLPGDLRRYGATFNGTNTAALLASCQQANQSGGSPVYIPGALGFSCAYGSGAAFTFTRPVKIYGDGQNLSAFSLLSDFTLFTLGFACSGSLIQGIQIFGIGLGAVQPGILYSNSNQNLIDNCTITQCGVGVRYAPGANSSYLNAIRNSKIISNNLYNVDAQFASHGLQFLGVTFGGGIAGASVTGITQAASAVITISTVSTSNPFSTGQNVIVTGAGGMSQINGVVGNITATGGSSGAWTITVNINSSAFTAYTSGGTLKYATTGVRVTDSGFFTVFGGDCEGLTYCCLDIDNPTSALNGGHNIRGVDFEGNVCAVGDIRLGASNVNAVIGTEISSFTLNDNGGDSFLNTINCLGVKVDNVLFGAGYSGANLIDGWLRIGANAFEIRVDNFLNGSATSGGILQGYGTMSYGQQPLSGAAPAIANNATINTKHFTVQRVSPAGAVTGIILQAGFRPGQQITLINEAVAANSVTMAAAGTSNVADGVSCVIAGLTQKTFFWDTVTALWYHS